MRIDGKQPEITLNITGCSGKGLCQLLIAIKCNKELISVPHFLDCVYIVRQSNDTRPFCL